MRNSLSKNKGRIALLNSPYLLNEPFFQHMPQLSLLYLAAYLEKSGFEPRICNLDKIVRHKGSFFFSFDLSELFNNLLEFQPDIIGITCPYSSRWLFTKRLTEIIQTRFKEIPIIIGGIHPTAFPEYCLAESKTDYIILGEGEYSTVELSEAILSGEKNPEIDGLAYKNEDKFILHPKTKFINELDELPFPAYHLLDMDKYKQICKNDRISKLKGLYFSLLTSRSCPNQCTYCNMFLAHGRKWRARSPENVLAEIEMLVYRYQVRQFAIVDDNFLFSRKRAVEILKGIIDKKLNIRFITPNGLSAKTLDDELVKLLKQAGALEISIAIESGSEYIRNEVYNKRIGTEQIYNAIRACKKYNLPARTFFMIGAPGETDETVQESLDMMRQIKVPSYINITTPYKGTRLYDYYLKQGVIRDEDVQGGTSLDIRLPIEKAENYNQILAWRKKMQVYNIFYSLKNILLDRAFMNINSISRFLSGILFPQKIDSSYIEEVLDKYMTIYHK